MSSEDDEPRREPPSRAGNFTEDEDQDEEAWFRRRQERRDRGEAAADSDDEQQRKKGSSVASIFNAVPVEREGETFAPTEDDYADPRVDSSGNPILVRRRRGRPTHNSLYRQANPSKVARRHPREPAAKLSFDSMSAYAPFQGFPIQWMSQVYDDAATYEGTEFINMPHGKGVFYAGVQGGGVGIQDLGPGDRYEGEFHLGYASGLGMLTKQDGTVFRGEFVQGQRSGCGAQVDLSPFYEEVARGASHEEAWEKTKDKVAATTQRGTFRDDALVSGPVDDDGDGDGRAGVGGSLCSLAEVEGTVEEVEHLVARARMFEHKPDGAVSTSLTFADGGAPAPLMQDPLHYPFGTKWMAPGPLGQCFRLPDGDKKLLEALDAAAHNHEVIWREFNLPRVIEPGTDMAAAVRHSEQVVAKARLGAMEPVEMFEAARRLRREAEEAERKAREERDLASGKVPAGGRRQRQRERISDEDLVADAGSPPSSSSSSSLPGSSSSSGRGRGSTSVFGSVTASLFSRGGGGGGGGNSRSNGNNGGENPAALLASALGRAAAAVASRVPAVGGTRGLARPIERE